MAKKKIAKGINGIVISEELKRYLISSGISFVTAFAIAILPLIDSLTVENVGTGALFALIFVGLRAGVKAIIEGLASKAV